MNRCGQNVHVEYTATEEFTSLYPIQPGNFSHGGVPDQEHQDYCAPHVHNHTSALVSRLRLRLCSARSTVSLHLPGMALHLA